MPVIVTITGKPLTDIPLSSTELMREIGLLARERIVRRTIAGLDQDETAFAPYSPGYAMQKAKELGGFGVNLQVSGAMLNAIQITDVTEKSVTLGFV
jgi:hypothetical protein